VEVVAVFLFLSEMDVNASASERGSTVLVLCESDAPSDLYMNVLLQTVMLEDEAGSGWKLDDSDVVVVCAKRNEGGKALVVEQQVRR
jgi:hypothetical protein